MPHAFEFIHVFQGVFFLQTNNTENSITKTLQLIIYIGSIAFIKVVTCEIKKRFNVLKYNFLMKRV